MPGNYIKLFIGSIGKIRRFPPLDSCQILAVDNGIEYLKECFPVNTSYFHLPVRGEVLYLNLHILLNLFRALGSRRRTGLGLRGCYVAAIAKYVSPGVLVTMIDNNNWDTNLSRYLNIPIICIGNGLRHPSHIYKKHFDCYFALSTAPVDSKLSFNCSFDEFHAAGHLKMGIYLEKYRNIEPKSGDQKPTLLWVSQFREFIYSSSRATHVQQKEAELMGVGLMSRFADNHNYIARVAISSERKKLDKNLEISMFESVANGEIQFPEDFPDDWVSYREVKNASLVLGMTSTLLFESLSAGKRVVFVLPEHCPDMLEHAGQTVRLDLIAPLTFSGNTYASFAEHCKQILRMSDAEYTQLIAPIQKDVAPLDKAYLPHHQIRDKISALLSA